MNDSRARDYVPPPEPGGRRLPGCQVETRERAARFTLGFGDSTTGLKERQVSADSSDGCIPGRAAVDRQERACPISPFGAFPCPSDRVRPLSTLSATRAATKCQEGGHDSITVTRDPREIAEDFVKVWDVSSPPGLAERAYDTGYVEHHPLPGQGEGIDGVNQLATMYFAVFPDLSTTVEAFVNDGDLTAVRWSGVGTHEGDQMGPPTHHRVHFSGIDILRISGGKVVEHWGETNGLEVMQQLQPVPDDHADS